MREQWMDGNWLHAVLDSTPVMLCVVGDGGRPDFFNRRWLEFVGRAGDEAHEHRLWDSDAHPEDRERLERQLERSVDQNVAFETRFRLRRGDGSYAPVRATGSPVARDGARGTVVTCYAPPEDRVGQLAGAADPGRGAVLYRDLAEAMPALVLTTTASGEVDYCNRRLLDYCGVAAASMRGTAWVDFIHPDDLWQGRDVFVARLRKLKPFVAEYRIRRADAAYRWHMTQTAPLFDQDSRIRGWLACSIDVDDRRRAEDEARVYAEELDQANAAKDEFFGLMSHELRTPLTTIYGNAHVLRRASDALDPRSIESAIGDIEREAIRLRHLIDNMFVLARSEGRPPALEPVLLRRVVRRIVDEHAIRYPARAVDVEDTASGGPVHGDADYVDQVMRNLLANAERSSPPDARITVSIEADADRARVRVLDRGRAVPREQLARASEAYHGVRDAEELRGAGLGLTVCKSLIDALEGDIWARPREGGGTEVGFTLPLESEVKS